MGQNIATLDKATRLAGLQNMVALSKVKLDQYLKFSGKNGRFTTRDGADDKEIPEGTQLVVNIYGAMKGWVCWKDREVVDDIHVPFFQQLPPEESLEDHGPYQKGDGKSDGWVLTFTIPFKDLQSKTQYIFKISNESGRREVGKLLNAALEQDSLYPLEKFTPVVTIESSPFKTKDGHKNYKPVFTIVEWLENPSFGGWDGETDQSKLLAAPANDNTSDADVGPDDDGGTKVNVPRSRKAG